MSRRRFLRSWLKTLVALAACALLLGLPPAVLGQQKIYDSTGFERQPFVAGLPLLGLDGWSPAIPPFLKPAAAKITNAVSRNGRQSVEVWGANLAASGGITAPYDAVGSYRRPLEYTVKSRKPFVLVEADLLLQTQQAATNDDFFSMSIAARSGDGETLGEIALSSAGTADVYGFDAAPGAPTVFTTPAALNQWHRLGIGLDYSNVTTNVAYFLDSKFIFATPTRSLTKDLLRASMVVYARPDSVGKARINYTARFDNFQVNVAGKHGDNDD